MSGREEDGGGDAIPSKKNTAKAVMNDYGLETEFSMAGVDYKHIHLEEVLLGPDYRRYL